MGYKISGIKSETARVFILKESDWSIESSTVISGTGAYEVLGLTEGTKLIFGRKDNGEVIGYGDVEATAFTQARGVYGGGYASGANNLNVIDYITISTPGNADDFGDLTLARYGLKATSNGEHNRGVFAGGYTNTNVTTMDYVNISILDNASSFGNLTVARVRTAATSNGTNERGVFGGGYGDSGAINVIDYITINSTSSAINFGDLATNRWNIAAASNGVNDRGVFGGYSGQIEYITISTTGNSNSFGNLSVTARDLGGTSNGISDRAVFAGGDLTGTYSLTNIIEYITISTTGNSDDFGDLTVDRFALEGISNGTFNRGVFAGGKLGGYSSNVIGVIDFITINSLSNATSFGGLQNNKCWGGGTSNA